MCIMYVVVLRIKKEKKKWWIHSQLPALSRNTSISNFKIWWIIVMHYHRHKLKRKTFDEPKDKCTAIQQILHNEWRIYLDLDSHHRHDCHYSSDIIKTELSFFCVCAPFLEKKIYLFILPIRISIVCYVHKTIGHVCTIV